MSEHTPDTTSGLADGPEPSMEDILASIRKIIADDEGNNDLALEMNDESDPNSLLQTAESDMVKTIPSKSTETLDLEIIEDTSTEEDIDLLIADMDMIDSDVSSSSDLTELSGSNVDDIMELEIPFEEDLVEAEKVSLSEGAINELVDPHVDSPVDITNENVGAEEQEFDDDLSAMLDDMMNDSGDDIENAADELLTDNVVDELTGLEAVDELENLELVIDPAEDLLAEDRNIDLDDDLLDDEISSNPAKTDTDMDLVKSLMADLTGVPLHDSGEFEDIEGDLLDEGEDELVELVPDDTIEMPPLGLAISDELETDTPDDVMDEILSLTLDDEIEIQDAELEAKGVEEPLTLKDIAAQAELEADSIEGVPLLASAGAAAAIGAAVIADDDPQSEELDVSTLDIDEIENDDVDKILSHLDEREDSQSEEDSFEEEPFLEVTSDLDTQICLLYTSPSPRDGLLSRMPSSA